MSLAHALACPIVWSENGATSPGRWQLTHRACRIAATLPAYVGRSASRRAPESATGAAAAQLATEHASITRDKNRMFVIPGDCLYARTAGRLPTQNAAPAPE